MKKLLLTAIAIVAVALCTNAQVKNRKVSTQSKQTTSSVSVKDSVAIIAAQAEKWFREVYVEKHFNDPYSYRLMKVNASPITIKEALEIDLAKVKIEIDTCSISEKEKTRATQRGLEEAIEESKTNIERLNKQIENGEDKNGYLAKRRDIYAKYLVEYLDYKKRIDIYFLAVETYDKIKKSIDELSEQVANRRAYYLIKLDCYSKNKIGNEVLGRFEFPFNEDGIFRGEKSVIQTNK